MSGLADLRGLFPLKQFYDTVMLLLLLPRAMGGQLDRTWGYDATFLHCSALGALT